MQSLSPASAGEKSLEDFKGLRSLPDGEERLLVPLLITEIRPAEPKTATAEACGVKSEKPSCPEVTPEAAAVFWGMAAPTKPKPKATDPLPPGPANHGFRGHENQHPNYHMQTTPDPVEPAASAHSEANPRMSVSAERPDPAPQTVGGHSGVGGTLTLDLGRDTGWVLLQGLTIVASGTLRLATDHELQLQREHGNEHTFDLRFDRLMDFLQRWIDAGVVRIVFENVQFVVSECQAHFWASLRAAIWAAVRDTNVRVFCVSVRTLKFFAGDGNADKSMMASALALADPALYQFDPTTGSSSRNGIPMDDNEVDAIWLARYTAAVDRGEEQFLSVHQRKNIEKANRRSRRLAAKAEKKSRAAVAQAAARAKAQAFKAAIKAAGRCCGVYRKIGARGKAVCPKCGVSIKLRLVGGPSDTTPEAPAMPSQGGNAVG